MRLDLGGVLEESIEKFAARSRGAAVKAKRELVKVVVQMTVPHGALVGAQQPAFEQRADQMHARQHRFSGFRRHPHGGWTMSVTLGCQPSITRPIVGDHGALRFDGLRDERLQFRGADRAHLAQADAAQGPRTDAFNGGHQQRLAAWLTPAFAGLRRAEIALIDLHGSAQASSVENRRSRSISGRG